MFGTKLQPIEQMIGLGHEIIWAPPLPRDQSRLIQDEIALVSAALHSRQTAMTNLGVLDPGAKVEQMAVEGGQSMTKGGPPEADRMAGTSNR